MCQFTSLLTEHFDLSSITRHEFILCLITRHAPLSPQAIHFHHCLSGSQEIFDNQT